MKDLLTTGLVLLSLVATLALAELGLLPTVYLEQWDTVATIFWALVPFVLCLFLSVLTRAIVRLGPLVAAELHTRSATNDAYMWQARHAAKAQRTGKN